MINKKIFACKFCLKEFDTYHKLGGHTSACKLNPNHDSRIKKISEKTKLHVTSEVTKQKLSIIRTEYLKENKHNHNWSRYKNEESLPEKLFKGIISKINLQFYQYYIPEESNRFFEIDFAIPSLKIGFEINGNQHYDGNKLAKYYHERHDYFEEIGWKIIEIPYIICFDKLKINDILHNAINREFKICEDVCNEVINDKINRKRQKEVKKAEIVLNKKKEKLLEIEKIRNNVLNSDIDFGKLGWVKRIAPTINQKPPKVNKWIKRYMLEFYTEKCFKKRSHRITNSTEVF